MNYWKEHETLRVVLIAVLFVVGIAVTIYGWTLTGKMSGLLIMIVGVCCLLAALGIYNQPFKTPRKKK